MSDKDSSDSGAEKPDNKPQEDLPPPPPKPVNLPTPDGFGDINRASQLAKQKAKKEKKNKKQRKHPKDSYEKLRPGRTFGCGGCLFALIVIVALPLGAGALWLNSQHAEFTTRQGYLPVRVQEKNVTEAPSGKTVFVGGQVLYEVPETRQEVAFLGGSWWLSGTFHEKVTFRGVQLVLEPGSKFMKGLDVQAASLDIGDAIIKGEIEGKILHQTASSVPPVQ